MAVRVIRARNTAPVVATAESPLKRAAAYCCVSTDSDEQETSYEAQVTHYTNYINENPGWELAGIIADEGLSGTQAKTRPQYFVEDDHDPIVPKAVFYQVLGEKKRRSGLAKDPSKLRFGNRLALNSRLICGKCGRTLKRYVKPDDALTDWRCRQRALVMAFNTLPGRREELVVQREWLLTGEIGRIDALLKTLDGQQDRLEERLEVLASQVPEDDEPMNTTVVDEVGSTQVITNEMDEAAFLRSQIVEIRRRKDALYAERAEHANTEVQIRLLLELVDEMVKNSLPEWMRGGTQPEEAEDDGSCRDYDDFFSRTKYTVPEGVLAEDGSMKGFNNDLVIRYLDKVVVREDGYEVVFKAGVTVEVEI